MTNFPIGTVVSVKGAELATVRSEPTLTASGEVVSLEFLPQFAHVTPTGWTDANVADLAEVRVCACATLGYRDAGQLVHTGCDLTRTPGKGRKFLPGHDAKAKSFLIKAWGFPMVGDHDHSVAAARQFGFSVQVAAGIDRAEKLAAKRAESPATKAVMRNLQKDAENSFEAVGYTFPTSSLTEFMEAAQSYLSDRSELKTATIETADYSVAYDYFRQS